MTDDQIKEVVQKVLQAHPDAAAGKWRPGPPPAENRPFPRGQLEVYTVL